MCSKRIACFFGKKNGLYIFLALLLSLSSLYAQKSPVPRETEIPRCSRLVAIILIGNKKTDVDFILREIQLKENNTYCPKDLKERMRKSHVYLYNMTLFHSVDLSAMPITEDEMVVFVEVKERGFLYLFPSVSVGRYNFGYWYRRLGASPSFLNYSLYTRHINVTGRGDRVDFLVRAGAIQLADLSYNRSYLGPQKKINIKGGVVLATTKWVPYSTQNHRPIYLFGNREGLLQDRHFSLEMGYRPYWKTRHAIGVVHSNASIAEAVYARNPYFFQNRKKNWRSLAFFYTVNVDTRNNLRFPLTGQYTLLSLRRTGVGLWNNKGLWSGSFAFFKYLRLHERVFFRYEMLNYYAYPKYTGYYLRVNLNAIRRYFLRGYSGSLLEGQAFSLARTELKFFVGSLRLPRYKRLPLYEKVKKYTDDPITFRLYPYVFIDSAWVMSYPTNRLPIAADAVHRQPLNDTLLYTLGVGLDAVTFYDITGSVFYTWNRQQKYGIGFNMVY